MRQRAIDEAVKLMGIQISDKVKKEIEQTIDTAAKQTIVDIEKQTAEWKKLVEEGKQVLASIQNTKQSDFAKRTDELGARMFEIEQSLLDKNREANRNPFMFPEHDAQTAFKEICNLIREIVNSVRSNPQYNGIAYNLSDHQLKSKILGGLICEHASYLLGSRFEKMEIIGSVADRL
jgi:seryl-tRNA synthetase